MLTIRESKHTLAPVPRLVLATRSSVAGKVEWRTTSQKKDLTVGTEARPDNLAQLSDGLNVTEDRLFETRQVL